MSLNFEFIHWEISKLQGLCKLPILTSYWWRHRTLDLKTNDIYKESTSNYIMLPNLSFLQWKNQSYKAFKKCLLWRHNSLQFENCCRFLRKHIKMIKLTKFWASSIKMAKLQGLSNIHQLWRQKWRHGSLQF